MEGTLLRLLDGRYAINGEIPLENGDAIEIFMGESWFLTRIEQYKNEYFAVGLEGLYLFGLRARIPEGHI